MNNPLFTKVPLVAKDIYQRHPALIPYFGCQSLFLTIKVRLLGVASATKGTLENKNLIFKQL